MTQWAQEWVEDLSRPDASIGTPLCPFAKKAWDAGDVKIVPADNLWDAVHQEIQNFGEHRLVMCVQEEPQQEYFELEAACMALNKWFAFIGADIWLLGYQKERTIVFVQRLSELDSASIALEKLGYYKHYEPEDYDRLIMQRRLLRKGTQQ
jgi:hypothetical protein